MTTIAVDFVGNESDLVGSFDKVGDASKRMTDAVEDSGKAMIESSDKVGAVTEGFDTVDTRAMGFRDTLTGVSDGLAGLRGEGENTLENLLLLGTGVGDLASGFVNFLIPTITKYWGMLISSTAAQWALNAAQTAGAVITKGVTGAMGALNAVIRANPVMFLVGLIAVLVLAFATLWEKSAGFRNFFIGMWNGIKAAFGAVVTFIRNAWNGLPNFFRGVLNGIKSIFSGVGDFFKGIFRGAINFVIDIINGAIGLINGLIKAYNAVPIAPDIPTIPKIPRLHSGGIVPGSIGTETLAILKAGETVDAHGNGGNGGVRVLPGGDKAMASFINYLARKGYLEFV